VTTADLIALACFFVVLLVLIACWSRAHKRANKAEQRANEAEALIRAASSAS